MCVRREMREGFQVQEMTPHLGGTAQLPSIGGGGSHGRTQSIGVPRDRFGSTMEMGDVGGTGKSSNGNGKEYERLPTQDRKE